MFNLNSMSAFVRTQKMAFHDHFLTDRSLKEKIKGIDLNFLELHLPESVFWGQNLRLEKLSNHKISRFVSEARLSTVWVNLQRIIDQLIDSHTFKDRIDLTKLDGLSASRSAGEWKNLYEFGHYNIEQFGSKVSDFEFSIKYSFGRSRPETVFYCHWDGKLFWMNDGGSHHASTAYYQAMNSNHQYSLNSEVTAYYINEFAAEELTNSFNMAVIENNHESNVLTSLLVKYNQVPFQSIPFTAPFDESHSLYFFPKSEPRSRMTYEEITRNENQNLISFNSFLLKLIGFQKIKSHVK